MRIFVAAVALSVALISAATRFPEAPTGFDNKTNGLVDDLTHQADQVKFEGVEQLSDGLGPLYNAQSCAECHPTNRLQPNEVTNLCNTVSEPNDTTGPDGLSDIDHFARFIRATKAPTRDAALASRAAANKGLGLFEKIGCASCHVEALTTAAAGTKINGGTFTIPVALGSITLHPYSDFLMHDVGTGDGILQATREHYGHQVFQQMSGYLSKQDFESSRNKIRTAPLWGVRLRPRLMHDGASLTLLDAIHPT